MIPTVEQLLLIAGGKHTKETRSNANSVHLALQSWSPKQSLTFPHRLSHFLGQLLEESGGFRYDREIWGPTPAQKRYDTRADLGNTPEVDGDGKKNAGRGPIQLTGGYNIRKFYEWCKSQGMNVPDFRKNPDLINTDPWEGLSAVWYWEMGNPTGKSLNVYADENNIIQITKKVNGGLTHLESRIKFYVRAALVFLGRSPTDVKGFQTEHGLLVDGDAGPLTLAALHKALASLSGVENQVKASPVVEETTVEVEKVVAVETSVPVVAKNSEKEGSTWINGALAFLGANFATFMAEDIWTKLLVIGATGLVIGFMMWRGVIIARRVKEIVKAFS